MDEFDKKIVKILKNNSKTTLQNISEKINLSIAPLLSFLEIIRLILSLIHI